MSNAWDFQRSPTSARQHRHTRLLPRERSGPGDGPSRNVLASCWLSWRTQSPALEVLAAGRLMRVPRSRHRLPLPRFSFPPNIYLRAVEAVRSLPLSPDTHRSALLLSAEVSQVAVLHGSAARWWLLEDRQRRPLGAHCQHGLSAGKAGSGTGEAACHAAPGCKRAVLLPCGLQETFVFFGELNPALFFLCCMPTHECWIMFVSFSLCSIIWLNRGFKLRKRGCT